MNCHFCIKIIIRRYFQRVITAVHAHFIFDRIGLPDCNGCPGRVFPIVMYNAFFIRSSHICTVADKSIPVKIALIQIVPVIWIGVWMTVLIGGMTKANAIDIISVCQRVSVRDFTAITQFETAENHTV